MSTNTESSDLMTQFYEGIFERVVERVLDARNARFPSVDEEMAAKLARINARPHITVQEAAVLLNCSESHLYKKIKEAGKGTALHPIPFLDLDGVYVLPREELLVWASESKTHNGPRRLKSERGNANIGPSPTAPERRAK